MLKFVRNELKDEYGILKLQDKILEVMVYIDGFCQLYDIDYCLMAGSALGARRHKGFIPWDDDIDIYMTEDDYLKFREKFEISGDHVKYYLQEWGKTDWRGKHMITMAKLRMNQTEIREQAFIGWKIHQGVFVDIFILHNAPSSPISQKLQYILSEAVVLKGLSIRGYNAKGIKDFLLLTLAKLIPKKFILKHGLYQAYKYQGIDTQYVSGFMDTRSFSRALYKRETIFPTKYTQFENVRLRIPCNNDEYLRIQFGPDYMVVPDSSKRQINKHSIEWTVGNENISADFSDENRLI